MIGPNLQDFRKTFHSLSERLRALRENFREGGTFTDADKVNIEPIQREMDALGLRLSEAERKGVNLVKDEFGGAWNSFVADLDLLELRLQDARAQGKV
jgi:hypothetical protein